jgi:hypothetical protein
MLEIDRAEYDKVLEMQRELQDLGFDTSQLSVQLSTAKISDDELRCRIMDVASDLMSNFLYYDRKEDENLPVGTIEKALYDGTVLIEDIIDEWRNELQKAQEYGESLQ